jgi:hypothetical protein
MDQALNRACASLSRTVLAAALLAAAASWPARAGDLPDPMRPTPGGVAAGPSRPAADAAPASGPAPDEELRLLSIRQPAGGRASALIGERWVAAGDRIEGWRVLAVDPDEVRLQREGERVVLRLWPKTLSPRPEAAAASAAQRTRSAR